MENDYTGSAVPLPRLLRPYKANSIWPTAAETRYGNFQKRKKRFSLIFSEINGFGKGVIFPQTYFLPSFTSVLSSWMFLLKNLLQKPGLCFGCNLMFFL